MENIIIANWAGVNTGDDAIFLSMLKQIKEVSDSDIFLMADNPLSLESKYPIEDSVRIFEFYKISNWKKIYEFLKKSSLVIYGGGDIVNENFASISFLHLAKLVGLPLLVWGVGVVPVKPIMIKHYLKWVLNQSHIIGVRDESSKELLENMGITKPSIKVTGDLALHLNPNLNNNPLINKLNDLTPGTLMIGLNIRNFDYLYSSHSQWSEKDLLVGTTMLCDYIVDKYDAHILFLPMVTGEKCAEFHPNLTSDDELMDKLINLMKNPNKTTTLKGHYTPEDLLGLMTKLDLIIAMRLHTLILGAKAGVPLLALDYAPKTTSFMSSIGLSDYLLDIKSITDAKYIDETLDFLDKMITNIKEGEYDINYDIHPGKKEYDNDGFKELIRDLIKNNQKASWQIHFFIPLMIMVSAINYLYQSILLIKLVRKRLL